MYSKPLSFDSCCDIICFKVADDAAIMDKIFETNSSFHVKKRTMGKVQFLFLGRTFSVLTKFLLWEEDWVLSYNSVKF